MIVVIDYGVNNIGSVANGLERLGVSYKISSDPKILTKARALILPGVGAAGVGMQNLKQKGLDTAILKEVKKGKPILGICLGMQLFLSSSDEGNVDCLGLIKGKVKKYKTRLKVPQIGWNEIKIMKQESKIMKNIPDNSYFYFINSYYCDPDDKSVIAGNTKYGKNFCSVLEKENIVGLQFHSEKSGTLGFNLLKNFIKYYVN